MLQQDFISHYNKSLKLNTGTSNNVNYSNSKQQKFKIRGGSVLKSTL